MDWPMITKFGMRTPAMTLTDMRLSCTFVTREFVRGEKSHAQPRKHQTEAVTSEGHEVVTLMSGAWRTYANSVSLRDKQLTHSQVDITCFLCLYEQSVLRTPANINLQWWSSTRR